MAQRGNLLGFILIQKLLQLHNYPSTDFNLLPLSHSQCFSIMVYITGTNHAANQVLFIYLAMLGYGKLAVRSTLCRRKPEEGDWQDGPGEWFRSVWD